MKWIREEWSTLDKSQAREGLGLSTGSIKRMSEWSGDMLSIGDFSSKIIIKVAVVFSEEKDFTVIAVQKFSAEDKVNQCSLWFDGDVFEEVAEAVEQCQVLPDSREDKGIHQTTTSIG